jgi:GDSL-like Lipase/Acylhydrolase family
MQIDEGAGMNRQPLFWVMLVAATLVCAALLVEGATRFFIDDGMQYDLEMWKYARDLKEASANPLIGHVHRPNKSERLMGVDVTTNSHRLRDREIPYERNGTSLRILMLGDSFTEGWGVRFDETFPKQIERLYADRGVRAEVINAGVGNYNTVMEVASFFEDGYKYKPDIVVLNFIPNDAEPIPPHPIKNWLTRTCYSCVYIFGRVDMLLRQTGFRSGWREYYLNLYGDGNASGWNKARSAIAQLADYCKSHHIKILISHIPELHELANYPLSSITKLLQQTAIQNGADFVDLLPDLRTANPRELWVSPGDAHPNGRANKLIANGLFRKLQSME